MMSILAQFPRNRASYRNFLFYWTFTVNNVEQDYLGHNVACNKDVFIYLFYLLQIEIFITTRLLDKLK